MSRSPRLRVTLLAFVSILTGFAANARAQEAPTAASDKSMWPYPIGDRASYSNLLIDLLEYQRVNDVNGLRWNLVGWHGGDERRLWIKSEASLYPDAHGGGEFDVQALFGKLVTSFFDLQVGGRFEQHREVDNTPVRAFAVIGLQGLSRYRFDLEPMLFLSNKGKLSGRFAASYDTRLTQRMIVQTRVETELAAQRDEEFGIDRGVNDIDVGIRVRHEIRREFAPYVGVTYRHRFAATADRVRREGGIPSAVEVSAGVRTWF
jgi:copper resistance protein B